MQKPAKSGPLAKPEFMMPHPALRPYIQNYLYFEVGEKDQWTEADISPIGMPVIIFAMGEKSVLFKEFGGHEPLLFAGQLTEFFQLHGYGRLRLFYVFFHPAGAYQLLRIPQRELKSSMLNLIELIGRPARILKEKLVEQKEVAAVKKVMEGFFLHQLLQQKKNEAAIHLAHAIKEIRSLSLHSNVISKICRQQGYSIKSLERHAKEFMGIGPKMLQRIMRFNKVLEYLSRYSPPYCWAQLAYQFGYSDQTHFIKDFKLFHGTTPGNMARFGSKLQLSLNCAEEGKSTSSILRVYK